MLPREYRIFKEYGNIQHGNLLSLMACDNIQLLALEGAKSFVCNHSSKGGKIIEADKK